MAIPFGATWGTLIECCEELPTEATLITPLASKRFRITNIHDQRIIIEDVDTGDADPEEYPGGVHYHLHYGYPGEEHPVVRYDNENIEGRHERHEGDGIEEIEFSALTRSATASRAR